ncbi:hypothetical protein Acsp01_45370 [Actinoplanes sp. NBRC 101535]|nr:hypothetical protein Acsp01_45370 [Actinoplanes sp. NBRC 101535]
MREGSVHATPLMRTVVTTDMEQDDLASLIRYLLYTNELDTVGIVYTSSRFHWAGDGAGTTFFLPGREYGTPQTSWRWTGVRTIQDQVLPAYAKVVKNLQDHDRNYPSPERLASLIAVGNIAFEGEMASDTPGSDLIRDLLLDDDSRPLYLQAWGGTNTIARALRSIEERYSGTAEWTAVRAAVSAKAVILASGFQDETYAGYIAPHWPRIRVTDLSGGYATWGYNCDDGRGNTRGDLFGGAWLRRNIQIGPLGSLYRSWLDGQAMAGDPLDVFGDPEAAAGGWCKPLAPYDFLSEGDNVVFNPLLDTGLRNPDDPTLGGWGGQAVQVSTEPNLWRLVPVDSTTRWATAAQYDFAARMRWTLAPHGSGAYPPRVRILGGSGTVAPGGSVVLKSEVTGRRVALRWWQYREEGTFPGPVTLSARSDDRVTVTIPAEARPGQTVSIILEGTADGRHPLTRYDRVILNIG